MMAQKSEATHLIADMFEIPKLNAWFLLTKKTVKLDPYLLTYTFNFRSFCFSDLGVLKMLESQSGLPFSGWMDGWMDIWMDGWMDGRLGHSV